MSTAGRFALESFQIAEGLALLLPVYAYFVIGRKSIVNLNSKIKSIHIPAVILSLSITVLAVWMVIHIQHAGGAKSFVSASPFFIRVAYRTVGMTLAWPFSIPLAMVSLFFLFMTLFSLFIPYKEWKVNNSTVKTGFGFAFIYLAGLQPVTVYQYSLTLLGLLLMATALCGDTLENRNTEAAARDDSLYKLLDELD
jgi:hypothetical protein